MTHTPASIVALCLLALLSPVACAQSSPDPFADEASDAAAADSTKDPFTTYEQDHTKAAASNDSSAPAKDPQPSTDSSSGAKNTGEIPSGAASSASGANAQQTGKDPQQKTPGATLLVSTLAIVGAALLVARRRER